MSDLDKVVKCSFCGRLYKFYAFSAADQSACQKCVAEAERAAEKPDTLQQVMRRARHSETP